MKAVGHKQERRFPGYSFLPRGGLSSPYVRFLTDADLIFNATSSGNVDPEDVTQHAGFRPEHNS